MPRISQRDLAGIELLSDLSPKQLADVEKRCRWRSYQAREQILDREGGGTDVYFVVEGKVDILNYSRSGREVAFAEVTPGSYFGELSALDRRKRSASAMAVADTTIASMSGDMFKKLLLDHPKVAFVILLHLAGMVRNADARIMDLSTLSAINRVQAEILRLAKLAEPGGNVGLIRPFPVHADIASRASTTRETVSRVISNLVRVRIVERAEDTLKVLDLERLANLIETIDE